MVPQRHLQPWQPRRSVLQRRKLRQQLKQHPEPDRQQQQQQGQQQREGKALRSGLLRQHDTLQTLLSAAQTAASAPGTAASSSACTGCQAADSTSGPATQWLTITLSSGKEQQQQLQQQGVLVDLIPHEEDAGGEVEWRGGSRRRYGVAVSSRRQLRQVVLAHWAATQGDKVPGSDSRQALAVEGLAGVAAVSLAGREADAWKLFNEDRALLLPLPPATAAGAAGAAGAPANSSSSDGDRGIADCSSAQAVVMGVFDGHGPFGAAASRLVSASLAAALQQLHHTQQQPVVGDSVPAPLPPHVACSSGNADAGSAQPVPPPAAAVHALLAAAFESAAATLAGAARYDFSRSGSTAVVCLVQPGRVTAAWCGDSRAVLGLAVDAPDSGCHSSGCSSAESGAGGRASSHAGSGTVGAESIGSGSSTVLHVLVHALTEDHRPNRPLERRRIEEAGGRVLQLSRDAAGRAAGPHRLCGDSRVWGPHPMYSRCFGDTDATRWGLTHRPDIASVELPLPAPSPPAAAAATLPGSAGTSADAAGGSSSAASPPQAAAEAAGARQQSSCAAKRRHVLILGSDGFWDTHAPAAAVCTALSCSSPQEAAERLAAAAVRRWAVETEGVRCDDVTVAVAFIPA